jgi:hypothetical protein
MLSNKPSGCPHRLSISCGRIPHRRGACIQKRPVLTPEDQQFDGSEPTHRGRENEGVN